MENYNKSSVELKVATDDQIFKRLNKKVNGLDRPLSLTPTIQNQGDLIKPDGTIAMDNEDIRLIEQRPLRTPTGVIEYKEATLDENFPVKIPLMAVKYDIESFMEAVDTGFNHFLKGFEQYELPEEVTINVLDNPSDPEIQVETQVVDFNQDLPEEEKEAETASTKFSEEWGLCTEINSSGATTGVNAGTIYVLWKGMKYRLFNGMDEHSNNIEGTPVNTMDGVINPPPIKGLTNTYDGRNLEVFLKDHKMTYSDIEIKPKADIQDFTSISRLPELELWDDIEWGSPASDGFQYNTNDVEIDDVVYEPGDIIKPSDITEEPWDSKAFLPDISQRWTEYHTDEVKKPVLRDQVYTPTGDEHLAKQWEGELIRAYNSGKSKGFYIVLNGEMRKSSVTVDKWATLKKVPPGTKGDTGENNWSEYHDVSYTAMDWNQFKLIGATPDQRAEKKERDPDSLVKISQHGDGTGWTKSFGVGFYSINNNDFPNDSISRLDIPDGWQVTLYEHSRANGNKKGPLVGPWNDRLRDWWNDQISSLRVEHGPIGFVARGVGWSRLKQYFAEDDYYSKPHLAPYNKLFS